MRSVRGLAILAALGAFASAASPASAQSVEPEAQPSAAFWAALGDPVLDRLIEQALTGSPELRAASARREGAGAARLGSARELGPVVRADAGFTRQRLASASYAGTSPAAIPDQELYSSGLSLAWELDFFGRLRGGLSARDALVGSADEDVRYASSTCRKSAIPPS